MVPGVNFYRRLLCLLKQKGIKAMGTLYHWDLPSALAEKGGWLSPESPAWFEAYARRCFELFDDMVDTWLTFNEPWCVCVLGYCVGSQAPGKTTNPGIDPYLAGHHILLAHARAYRFGPWQPDQIHSFILILRQLLICNHSLVFFCPSPWGNPMLHNLSTVLVPILLFSFRAGLGRDRHRLYKGVWGAHRIGITLNCEWREPKTSGNQADMDAQQRDLDFCLGWFAEPLFLSGDYPAVMRERVKDRLPRFTDEEKASLLHSSDFFGFNWYSARMTASPTCMGSLLAAPSLVRMLMAEPFGLIGAMKGAMSAAKNKEAAGNYMADIGAVPSFRGSWRLTDMSWPVVPWALARHLVQITEKYKPKGGIIITENGVAVPGEDDCTCALDTNPGRPGAKRVSFVRSHLVAIHQAISHGADVRGYFLWSLLDNFEWAFGYTKRFGAFHVDYPTQKRTAKPVVAFYRDVMSANAVIPSPSEAKLDSFAASALDFRPDDW